MTPLFRRRLALALALSFPAAGYAQSGSVDPPSRPSGHVYITNTTDRDVVYYVESENMQRTEHKLAPGTADTVRGDPGDTWFNITLQADANALAVQSGAPDAASQ
jgi:hypothetical protein